MKKLVAMIMVSSAGLLLASCAEPATEDEVSEMCQHWGEISGKAAAVEEASAKVAKMNEEYDAKLQQLKDESAKAVARIQEEQDAALAETKPQEQEKRAPIIADFAKKEAAKTGEFDGKIKQLSDEREAAVGKAKEAADAADTERNDAVNKCVTDGTRDGVSKQVAQCRIAAATADDYENKCK
jgi:uncharacterized phage infection (PIP) family protein YhgE